MKTAEQLRDLGQSLWLDNIGREILDGGTSRHFIDEPSITSQASHATAFRQSIAQPPTAATSASGPLRAAKKTEEIRITSSFSDATPASGSANRSQRK